MPSANVGEVTSLDRKGVFIKLKTKDEKFRIRFASLQYQYEGKHIIKNDQGKWDVSDCPRINEENPCEICQKAFDIKKELKGVTDENIKKAIHEKARPFEPKITFYYAVLDRDLSMAKVLETTTSIRIKLETKMRNGEKILNYDYIITRTENPGAEYYALDRVDSAETVALSEKEINELELAKNFDLEKITGGGKASELEEVEDITDGERVFAEGGVEITTEEKPVEEKKKKLEDGDEIPF